MGTQWSARVVAAPPDLPQAIGRVLDRVVAQMSQWEPGSDLSRFNASEPGRWQPLPAEFSLVLGAALEVAEASGGAFDPAMGAPAELWGFGASGPRADLPGEEQIAAALARSGRSHIAHDPARRLARRLAPAALDLSGIAKGYAVDALAAELRALGLEDFLVEIGGEFVGAGIRPDGQPWWVDVEPLPGASLPGLRIALHGLAVATSGDYRRYLTADGRRHAHTLDPRTGRPVTHGVASVTVLHPRCMLADAWATALTVLGPEQGPGAAEREGLAMRMVVREGAGFRELLSPALEAMLV